MALYPKHRGAQGPSRSKGGCPEKEVPERFKYGCRDNFMYLVTSWPAMDANVRPNSELDFAVEGGSKQHCQGRSFQLAD